MKTLAVILAVLTLTAGAWGQGKMWDISYPVIRYGHDTIPMYVATPPPFKLGKDEYIVVALSALWSEWKDSCWADSTKLEKGNAWVESWAYSLCSNLNGPGKFFWLHRDPNNLPAFMEFLERRKE